ncbi:hypothetical protein DL93DRAFT_2092198 [Clavulina sp. PMI_390]|nr:hypothetical protein DL93DRAFT_2092198 [Clavulina sp. PMI_390]
MDLVICLFGDKIALCRDAHLFHSLEEGMHGIIGLCICLPNGPGSVEHSNNHLNKGVKLNIISVQLQSMHTGRW